MKSILTLYTSAKNPDPIFSSLKSLRLVSWKTAERTAMKEALLGRGRLLPPSPWSRSSTWISSPILVSRSENYWLLHRSIALITAHVMTNNFTELYGRIRLIGPTSDPELCFRDAIHIIWNFYIWIYTEHKYTYTTKNWSDFYSIDSFPGQQAWKQGQAQMAKMQYITSQGVSCDRPGLCRCALHRP